MGTAAALGAAGLTAGGAAVAGLGEEDSYYGAAWDQGGALGVADAMWRAPGKYIKNNFAGLLDGLIGPDAEPGKFSKRMTTLHAMGAPLPPGYKAIDPIPGKEEEYGVPRRDEKGFSLNVLNPGTKWVVRDDGTIPEEEGEEALPMPMPNQPAAGLPMVTTPGAGVTEVPQLAGMDLSEIIGMLAGAQPGGPAETPNQMDFWLNALAGAGWQGGARVSDNLMNLAMRGMGAGPATRQAKRDAVAANEAAQSDWLNQMMGLLLTEQESNASTELSQAKLDMQGAEAAARQGSPMNVGSGVVLFPIQGDDGSVTHIPVDYGAAAAAGRGPQLSDKDFLQAYLGNLAADPNSMKLLTELGAQMAPLGLLNNSTLGAIPHAMSQMHPELHQILIEQLLGGR